MTKREDIAMIERKIQNRKELLKKLTNPEHIKQCELDIEQYTKLLGYAKIA